MERRAGSSVDEAQVRVDRLARSLGAQVLQTHISWVLLAGDLAYKLKKPVRLPFVDYSTCELRRHFCEEEVRLNARLAGPLYLGVSRITGDPQSPTIDGSGATLDWAVRMKRFPEGALFSDKLRSGTLPAAAVDRLAQRLAGFHATATPAGVAAEESRGQPLRRAQAALAGAGPLLGSTQRAALARWLDAEWARVGATWLRRLREGRVREGHGDLHLANIIEQEGEVLAFDCVEFDAALRRRDIVEDAGFALMDFAARGRPDLGWRFFNAWLEHTGEYEGLALLRFYLVGHALVRAQVEHLRSAGADAASGYARSAVGWSQPAPARLVITCGLPGSGKTWQSQRLLEAEHCVRIRSDVERKRLFGLGALADTRAQGIDAYTPAATQRTYARLFDLARLALQAGWPVVLDAAFLRREERAAARSLAGELGVPLRILACEAPLAVLQQRLADRSGDASEADCATLERLRAGAEPLTAEELRQVLA